VLPAPMGYFTPSIKTSPWMPPIYWDLDKQCASINTFSPQRREERKEIL
jgi:hypothetical protein